MVKGEIRNFRRYIMGRFFWLFFRSIGCWDLLLRFMDLRIFNWLGNLRLFTRLGLSTARVMTSQYNCKSIKRYRIKSNCCYLGAVLKADSWVCDESPEEERETS